MEKELVVRCEEMTMGSGAFVNYLKFENTAALHAWLLPILDGIDFNEAPTAMDTLAEYAECEMGIECEDTLSIIDDIFNHIINNLPVNSDPFHIETSEGTTLFVELVDPSRIK